MTDNTLRLLDDFLDAMSPTDTPFINRFKLFTTPKSIGEKDAYGRTLIGWAEVDEAARDAAYSEWQAAKTLLDAQYKDVEFEEVTDEESGMQYWQPVNRDFDREYTVSHLWHQYNRLCQRKPIFDPSDKPRMMEWGLASTLR